MKYDLTYETFLPEAVREFPGAVNTYPLGQPHIVYGKKVCHLCLMRYKDTTKADEMRSHIEACRAGTQTVEEYCGQHGIKKSNYYYWYKRLSRQSEAAGFVALNIAGHQKGDVVMSFPNGVSISFNSNISASVLKELVCCI